MWSFSIGTQWCNHGTFLVETVQHFLIKLGINPLMHLLEIGIFSLNEDIVRLTNKSHFSVSKIGRIFPKTNFCEEYLIRRPTYINETFLKTLIFKVLYLLKMCPIFVGSVHNFGMLNLGSFAIWGSKWL